MLELKESQLWLHGSSWLRHGDLLNTEDPGEMELFPAECLFELRANDRESLALTITEKKEARIGAIMSIEHLSSLEKLIMSTAILLSFVGKLKQKLRNRDCSEEVTNDLKSTEEEKVKAESLWIWEAQRGSIKEDWRSQFMLYLPMEIGDVVVGWVALTCHTILSTQYYCLGVIALLYWL